MKNTTATCARTRQTAWSFLLLTGLLFFLSPAAAQTPQPLKVAIAGLSHDHVYLLMQHYHEGAVTIVGIAESNPELIGRFKKRYHLPDSLFFQNLSALLDHRHPEIVMAFDPTAEHVKVVGICAPRHLSVMVEKPLATTEKDAEKIAALAAKYGIHVLTDYETSWYASNQAIGEKIKQNTLGGIRKMVAHDGHQGPREIGVSREFFQWLTDPVSNGAGALFDFGCYGANLMTWLMEGKAPLAVTAVTKQIKPGIYPKVDDDATLILEYPEATGIIEASWNWPFNIKDLEVFGKDGYLQAVDRNTLRIRKGGQDEYTLQKLAPPPAPYQDYIPYVTAVVRGKLQPGNDLSSLENNLIVVKILSAARLSAREGKRIVLR